MTFEKSISAAIRKHIESGFPGSVARKRHVVAGVMGDPDIYGSVHGYHFEIEVKQPGRKPTKLQQKRLDEWSQAGAITGVAHDVGEAIGILQHGLFRLSLGLGARRENPPFKIPDDSEEI